MHSVPFSAFLSEVFNWKLRSTNYSNMFKDWFDTHMPISSSDLADALRYIHSQAMHGEQSEMFTCFALSMMKCLNDDFSIKSEYC